MRTTLDCFLQFPMPGKAFIFRLLASVKWLVTVNVCAKKETEKESVLQGLRLGGFSRTDFKTSPNLTGKAFLFFATKTRTLSLLASWCRIVAIQIIVAQRRTAHEAQSFSILFSYF